MAPVPNGVYALTRQNEQLLTLPDGSSSPGTPAVLLPPTGNPGEQEWEVQGVSNGNVTIRNLRGGTYLGFDGDPKPNSMVEGRPEAREWVLYQSGEPFAFHVVVPGGPVDGEELTLDLSLLRIFPPRLALRPLDSGDMRQAWKFEYHE